MTQVHEFSTWSSAAKWESINAKAVAEAKKFSGEKWTVAIGEWGGRTFLVLGATSKEEAKQAAVEAMGNDGSGAPYSENKVVARNVTNAKKYQ